MNIWNFLCVLSFVIIGSKAITPIQYRPSTLTNEVLSPVFLSTPSKEGAAHLYDGGNTSSKKEVSRADYTVTYYADDNCKNAEKGNHDGIRLSKYRGCYDIVGGSLAGYSFRLFCTNSTNNDAMQYMYADWGCQGLALKSKITKWDFFEGHCNKKERLDVPMRFEHYPACRQKELNNTEGNNNTNRTDKVRQSNGHVPNMVRLPRPEKENSLDEKEKNNTSRALPKQKALAPVAKQGLVDESSVSRIDDHRLLGEKLRENAIEQVEHALTTIKMGAEYIITVFQDDDCSYAKENDQHGFKATLKPYCFDEVWGSSRGSSFKLTCSNATGSVIRTMYKSSHCESNEIKTRLMNWSFFQGECHHKARMDPPMKYWDIPVCKL